MGSIKSNSSLYCDVLVVGSGPGGSVTASELHKRGVNVLLVEEGPFTNVEIKNNIPLSINKYWRNNGLTVALGNSPLSYAEGSCVGGGSEINTAIIQRTPSDLLDQWADKYEIHDFSELSLSKFYNKAYEEIGAQILAAKDNPLADVMLRGSNKLKWRLDPLERAHDGKCQQSMSVTLLKESIANGLRLISNCLVKRIVFSKSSAQHVEAEKINEMGEKVSIRIYFRDIFIACGAINTPKLLLNSGIKKNIGRSLAFHPTIKVLARFAEEINGNSHILAPYAITEFMPDIRLGCSVFRPGFFGMAIGEDWEKRSHLKDEINMCGIYYAMIRPKGVGVIRSIPGLREPFVTYKFKDSDWDLLKTGVNLLGQFLFAAGALEVYPSVSGHSGWKNSKEILSGSSLFQFSKRANPFSIHVFSSCPMGENMEYCAANSYGKLHQLENVYLADASLIPEAPGVNPQATIMALSYRNINQYIQSKGY